MEKNSFLMEVTFKEIKNYTITLLTKFLNTNRNNDENINNRNKNYNPPNIPSILKRDNRYIGAGMWLRYI